MCQVRNSSPEPFLLRVCPWEGQSAPPADPPWIHSLWRKDRTRGRAWEAGSPRSLVATEEATRLMHKVHVNVGTIGHIDHGKTTLTAAILAVQAQKGLAEAQEYGYIARGGRQNVRGTD